MVESPHKNLSSKCAGRVMTKKVPTIRPEAALFEVEKMLFEKMKQFETINYIYVIDNLSKLVGIISIKEIFRQPKSSRVADCMKTKLVKARPHTHQERIAISALKHNLKAIPIVDKKNNFLGVIPSDVILNILHQENTEDFLRNAGVSLFRKSAESIIFASTFIHLKKRLPWLILGLFGGVVAAFIIGFFESALEKKLILASFIPLIVYMSDAAGSQTQTLYIRSVVLDNSLDLAKYIFREIKVGLSLSAVLGLIISIFSLFWQGSLFLGAVLGVSIFITILVAMAVAILLPFGFMKFKFDPAIASGPLATIVRDLLGLIIYFAVAQIFLRFF
jgi:magnesium transporter